MGELITTLTIVFLLLVSVCFIGTFVLSKDTKEFHIKFGLLKGFEVSASFYKQKERQ